MKKIYLLLFAIFLSACLPNGLQIPQSPALRFFERKSGLISYVGNDGNIYLIDQSGTSNSQLTKDVTLDNQETILYRLPAWSRDSTQIAFMRHERENENAPLISEIFIANAEDETVKKVLSGNQFTIYFNWSPDNQHIGLLSNLPSGEKIILQSVPSDGSEKQILDTGNPLYWSWAPDGKTMLVHKNGSGGSIEQLVFLKNDTDVTEFVLDEKPAAFLAPAWSPSGEHILMSTLSAEGNPQILLTDSSGGNPKVIFADVEYKSSFAWAPDSEQFAYILGNGQLQNGTAGRLRVGNIFDDEEIELNEGAYGFFWSPDSSQLAYFIPFVSAPQNEDGTTGLQALYLSLNILDIASGESKQIATYRPTPEFMSIMPFIDQYHQSITIWSPDSNNLVISFLTEEEVSGIAIVPASGVTEPRFLAEGNFAVWSWK